MTFLSLLETDFTSILTGIIVTAAIMATMYFVLKSLSRVMVRTTIFYITGIVTSLLLIVQISLMTGAFKAKGAADAAEIYLHQLFENETGIVGANDSQQIIDNVTDKFPIIGVYINIADFSGHDVSDIAESMHETMISYFNTYILHRVLWSLCIIIVASLIIMMYDKRNPATQKSKSKNKATTTIRKSYDDF